MTLWGGRFEEAMGEGTWAYTVDRSDRRLLEVDIRGSLAHVQMLGSQEIISDREAETLKTGLEQILEEVEESSFEFLDTDEDVHSAVERRLGQLVGEIAGKMHTGRSRNDQVALDLRLYLRDAAAARVTQLKEFASALADVAEGHANTVVASYTHLQQAQPTTLGHHLLAYAWMALRSAGRFEDVSRRLSVSPLGAGASSGSSLPLDREATARALGFGAVMANSLDAVGSRDFVAEYVFCCAQAMADMSRLAEEVILWTSSEFGWAGLSDDVSTGSSALPQKRNPDIAELVRGRASGVAADVIAILGLQKGLPLAYNRDLQEDKRIVFHADDTAASSIVAMIALVEGLDFDPPPPGSQTVSLDLAEALVRKGVPFREAHGTVGSLVRRLESEGRDLSEANLTDLQTADGRFEEPDLQLLDPASSVAARATSGSGNPQSVLDQIAEIRRLVG
jgi:argininosuccinate lyase